MAEIGITKSNSQFLSKRRNLQFFEFFSQKVSAELSEDTTELEKVVMDSGKLPAEP